MELWDIYDKDFNKTGRTHERGKSLSDGDYHLVVHVWIMNSKDDILISKRHPNKHFPNLWECTGGSVLAGESSLQGALRETKEELGIDLLENNGKLIKTERRDIYNDFYDVWLFKQDVNIEDINMQQEEVTDVKWVNRLELKRLFEDDKLVPTIGYFEIIFD